jgi:hypothetical protein
MIVRKLSRTTWVRHSHLSPPGASLLLPGDCMEYMRLPKNLLNVSNTNNNLFFVLTVLYQTPNTLRRRCGTKILPRCRMMHCVCVNVHLQVPSNWRPCQGIRCTNNIPTSVGPCSLLFAVRSRLAHTHMYRLWRRRNQGPGPWSSVSFRRVSSLPGPIYSSLELIVAMTLSSFSSLRRMAAAPRPLRPVENSHWLGKRSKSGEITNGECAAFLMTGSYVRRGT